MLAAVKTVQQPYFERLEIVRDQEFSFRTYDALKPIKKGDAVPDFIFEKDNNRWQQFYNGVETHGPIPLRRLLNKTLVVAFYSGHWQAHGLDLLKQLNSIHERVGADNANFLIISAEKERKLEKIAWDDKLSLSFYFDTDKSIAEKFGVYSENDPVWNRFSGVDTNVPLLATYVVSAYGIVLFDHIDWDFSGNFPAKEVITAISN